jgi:hypothetical protein
VPPKTTSRSRNQAAEFVGRSKGLNLRRDSKCRSAVTFLTVPKINSQIGYVAMRQEGFFEQPSATMPISDYARAFFFDRPQRVTPQGPSTISRRRGCYFQNARGHLLARVLSIAGANITVIISPACCIAGRRASRNTEAREFRAPLLHLSDHKSTAIQLQTKKPGCGPGFCDEFLFQSVHFASLAI